MRISSVGYLYPLADISTGTSTDTGTNSEHGKDESSILNDELCDEKDDSTRKKKIGTQKQKFKSLKKQLSCLSKAKRQCNEENGDGENIW